MIEKFNPEKNFGRQRSGNPPYYQSKMEVFLGYFLTAVDYAGGQR
jgi:hypothetical protein